MGGEYACHLAIWNMGVFIFTLYLYLTKPTRQLDYAEIMSYTVRVNFGIKGLVTRKRNEPESALINWNETFSKFEPHSGGIDIKK